MNKDIKPQHSKAFRDLVLVIVATIFIIAISYFFSPFALIVEFIQKHPEKIVYIDEVITGLLALSIGLAIFSWRRWAELKKETAQRIKKQQELVELSTTQAEVERIISKQLRSDMDQMKEDVREIRCLLVNKPKREI